MRKDVIEDSLNLTPLEQEVITLKAVMDMIGDMVNHEILTVYFEEPDSSIVFKTATCMAFFNIILVDFLSRPSGFFKGDKSYIDRLKEICITPGVGEVQHVRGLNEAVCAFDSWLSEEVTIPSRWFPALDLQIDLTITRQLFITICGNITKHNFTQLTRQAERLRHVFGANGKTIPLEKCILALKDFRQQFYDDVFHYHSSTIAEFLNNIQWGIYSYAVPVRERCVRNHFDEELRMNAYTYAYPSDLPSEFGRICFWDLLNNVMRQPYVQQFKVAKYLKTRY